VVKGFFTSEALRGVLHFTNRILSKYCNFAVFNTTFNDPMQLVEKLCNIVETETIPDIVGVVIRVGRPKSPKPSFRSTKIPMETILEAVGAIPTQTQGKKRGCPKKNANGDATVTSTVEPSLEATADERPRTQKSAQKS
jgi:hypothetical protein